MTDPLNHLGSIWYHSEPLEISYLTKPVSWFGLFCHFLQQTGSSTLWIVPKKPNFVNQSIENAEKHGQIKDSYYNSYKSPKLCGKRGKFIFVPKIDLWKFFFLSLSILESTELKQASCDPPPKKTSSIMCTAETWLCARKSVKARVSHNALSKCTFSGFSY